MALTVSQIADLVASTQKDLGKLKWTDLTGDLQSYTAMPNILQKEKVKFGGSVGYQFNAMTGTSGNAAWVGLYGTDTTSEKDNMTSGNVGWAHCTTSYAFDRREEAMNSGSAYRIFDLIKTKRSAAMIDLANILETSFWGVADTTNNLKPFGVKNYLCYSASAGFNGTAPTGFTTVAGINPTTQARWRNYTNQYTNVTKADLIDKLKLALYYCDFKSPLSPEPPSYRRAGKGKVIYTSYPLVGYQLEKLAENQNDNLGPDLAKFASGVMIRRNPVEYVPQLDSETSACPVVGIDWGVFYPVFLEGEYMKEDKATQSPTQHTVAVVHVDCTLNYVCVDRRPNFLIAKAAW